MTNQNETLLSLPKLSLHKNDIHIWCASTGILSSRLQELTATLSGDELERAEKFHFIHHREHYITGRAILRDILGKYLDAAPAVIRFCYNAFGKPSLQPPADRISFNLSHSGALIIYAITGGAAVGIDIESVHSDFDVDQLARRSFAVEEYRALALLPAGLQKEMFFRLWTRKEAYIKALGKGLQVPLHQFDVTGIPGKPVLQLHLDAGTNTYTSWYIREIHIPNGYHAAIAAEGNDWNLSYFQWPDGMN